MVFRPLAILLSAVALLGTAAAAGAQPLLVIDGAGDGHGVGMSQVGAEGLALHGYTYQEILAHYYTGTSLEQLGSEPDVSVLLAGGRYSIGFTGGSLIGRRALGPTAGYRVVAARGGRLELEGSRGRRLASLHSPAVISGPGALTLGGTAINGIANGQYGGAFELLRSGSAIDVINIVPLETYLLGVVPAESPSSWQPAELEAQAVAARTYAITSHDSNRFELYADTQSQQYDGVRAEAASTNAAVAATTGEIVTYDGQPATTYFFASSGGETENIQDAFLGATPEPWLVAVLDPYDTGRWGPLHFTLAAAARRLGPLLHGTLRAIRVTTRGISPRVVSAEVVGSRGTTTVSGPDLEVAFGLDSTWACFDVTGSSGEPRAGWDAACSKATGPPAQGSTGPSGSSGSSGASGGTGSS
jgi:stage II sporulation protein D